jgi:FlaA1/EpsC-like NDP-sugar epimerase
MNIDGVAVLRSTGGAERLTSPRVEREDLKIFEGGRVLVTGAGGSIGSALCQAIAEAGNAARLVMLDRDDTALHALFLATEEYSHMVDMTWQLGDICNEDRIVELFSFERPQIVLHTAALKHVPLLESNPEEGYRVNVLGTRSVLRAAARCGAEVLVNVSSDKSSNPTTTLGRTKRLGERLTAHVAAVSGRRYLSVRMGNVLGSRGSFLPRFLEQIARGEPVTVTHEDVTRFLMTLEDVVAYIARAAAYGVGGETLIADLGEPVRILDVAQALVDGSGRRLPIRITGLRPGDKLHEDVLDSSEVPVHVAVPGIVTGVRVPPVDPDALDLQVFLRSLERERATPVETS